jgi:hypothetical protein
MTAPSVTPAISPALNLPPEATGSVVNVEDGEGKDRERRVRNVSKSVECAVENNEKDTLPISVVVVLLRVTVGSSDCDVGVGGTDRERGIVKENSESVEDGGVDGRDESIVNSASVLVVIGAVRERGIGKDNPVGVEVANGGLTGVIKTKSDIVKVTDGGLIGGVLGDTGN